MALNDYARLVVFFNGRKLEQITSASMKTDSGQQRVDLMNEGLGGFTPGSGTVEITFGYAIPAGGTEEPFQEECVEGNYVVLQLGRGNKDYVGEGKIMTVDESQSTNASVEGSVTWTGEFKKFE